MRILLCLSLAFAMWSGCKARGGADSGLREAPPGQNGVGGTSDGIPLWTEDAVLGANPGEGNPKTRIILEENFLPVDRTFGGGNEYWLYGIRGASMRAWGTGTFSPYNGPNTPAERRVTCQTEVVAQNGWCDWEPSEMARRCMRQSANTLDAIRASGINTCNHGFFGWINDGARVPGASASRGRGIWVYGTSLIKWVGAVSSNGICETPGIDELKTLLRERGCDPDAQ